jgi:GT2 family glycosyltransferase
MAGDPSVDIVVVTYNTADFIPGLLRSIKRLQHEPAKLAVYLVDNCSQDDTLEVAHRESAQLRIPIKTVQSPVNAGFAGGANQGIEQGRGEYICVVNPDAEFGPNTIAELVKILGADERIAIADARQSPHEHPKCFDLASGETSWCSGACCLIRRSALEKVGGFDAKFFMYCEDVDLSWRFWRSGYKCLYARDAVITHHKTIAPDRTNETEYFYGVRNGLLMRLIYGNMTEIFRYYSARLAESVYRQRDPQLRRLLRRAFWSHLALVPHALRRRLREPKPDCAWIRFNGILYGEHRW